MEKNRISDFLESIDSEKWNCVYQTNGMTLLTTKEYDYRYKERINLQTQLKKQQEINKKAIEYIKENKEKYYQDWGQDDCSTDIYLDEYEVFKLLQVLEDKEV